MRRRFIQEKLPKGLEVKILLDSGAFSALTQGAEITLDEYIKYIKRNKEFIDSYVALDVMPAVRARKGKGVGAKDIDATAKASFENYLRMKDAGLDPMPVVHMGEHPEWLHRYLDLKVPYIGLSRSMKEGNRVAIKHWLNLMFDILTTADGKPVCRTHGFGITAASLCCDFPWYTFDSIAWARPAGMGICFIPHFKEGTTEFDYRRYPRRLHISNNAQKILSRDAFNRKTKIEQAEVRAWFKMLGVTMADVRNDYGCRAYLRVCYYNQIAAHCADRFDRDKDRGTRQGLGFAALGPHLKKPYVKPFGKPKVIYVATGAEYANVLNRCNIADRLISYWTLRNMPDGMLEHLKTTGHVTLNDEPQLPKFDWKTKKNNRYKVHRSMKLITRRDEYASNGAD